jgi:hypothetical protein
MKSAIRSGLFLGLMTIYALGISCSGQKVAVQTADDTLTDLELWRSGLARAESRDYNGALADVQLANQKNPTLKYELAVAHLLFLNKSYRDAVKKYEELIAGGKLSRRQQEELKKEVARIEDARGEVTGRSLAGQWIRATAAVLEAELAIEKDDYAGAYKYYDKAYQYNQDYELLLESALAASRAKQWEWAHQKLKEYVAVGADEIPRDMQYRVYAEIDRIMAILKGEAVVTEKSLADEIYAERNGEEEEEGLPPSMLVAAAASGDTDSSNETEAPEDSEATGAAQTSAASVTSQKDSVAGGDAQLAEGPAAPSKAEQKRLAKEAARKKAEEARARQLALKAEREEQRKAALAAKRQKEIERKAALAKKKEEAQKRKEEARARREEAKQARLLEKKLAREAKEKEREIARQEKLAKKEAEKARKAELAAARLAEKERLKDEKGAAAEEARAQAAAEREAAEQARREAQEKRAQLKEERRLAALTRAEEKKREREAAKQRKAEERAQKAEALRLEKEERLALVAERKREKEEARRMAAEERRAAAEEKQAEKERMRLEKELAAQQSQESADAVAEKPAKTPDEDGRKVATGSSMPGKEGGGKSTATAEPGASAVALKKVDNIQSEKKTGDGGLETSFEDLLFYARSKSATVRYRAVRDLIPLLNDRSRAALEDRVIQDRNIHVRFLAIEGLVQRQSVASLPILEHALVTAATLQERAMLKNAIDAIRLGRK